MRGRKPTPIKLLKGHGTFRKDRHARRAVEPKAPGALPPPPEWLSKNQLAIWGRCVAHAPAGVLAAIDGPLLVAFVIAVDTHQIAATAQNKLDAGATLPLLWQGTYAASPYLKIIHQSALRAAKIGGELGFSPTSRARLGAPESKPPPDAGWEKLTLLRGGKADDEPPDVA